MLPEKLEGLGWYTHEIVRRLVASHPDDEFFFLFDRPFDPQFIYGKNVVPLVVSPPARHPILWYLWFEMAVPRVLKKIKPDVFFSPDSFCSLKTDVPTVMTLHDIIPIHHPEQVPFFPRIFYQNFLKKYAQRADRLVVVSEFVKNDVAETLKIPLEKITVAPNGCREIFCPIPENEKAAVRSKFSAGQPYFFYAGSIHPRKNVARLILAFDLFKNRSNSAMKLLIGGRFLQATPDVKLAFENAKHRADIHFLGYLNENDLAKLTAAAFALTYFSTDEGFGLPVLEAMNCDVPVLTSSVSSLPEVAGDAAILADPFSENEMADAMFSVFENENLRKNLIEKGRAQRQKFSWDLAAARVSDLLDLECGIYSAPAKLAE